MSKHVAIPVVAMLCLGLATYAQQPPAPTGQPVTNLGSDANGNPLRLAVKTGHISNYDESKVRPYVLPDPLVTGEGERVRDARRWRVRRTEILRMYGAGIYGRVPANAPKVTWQVGETDRSALSGTATLQHVVGTVGSSPAAPHINVQIYTPANAKGPVPLILMVNFGGGDTARGRGAQAVPGTGPGAAILARGWGYATVGYQDIQPDRANAWTQGVIGLTLAPRWRCAS